MLHHHQQSHTRKRHNAIFDSLIPLKRDLTDSPIVDTPEYASLVALIELYGGTTSQLWWIGADTMGLHDSVALTLRKLELNYRTQKAKAGKKVTFTVYFQQLPDVFGTYRPSFSVPAKALLETWQKHTATVGTTKYVAANADQVRTLSWCLGECSIPHRVVERPVVWKGRTREGFYIDSEDLSTSWKSDREKSRVGEVLRILTT